MHKECEKHFPLFPTVNYISKIGKDNFRSVLSENGVFQGQDEILFLIMHKEGLKPSEIAKYLHTSLASISVSLMNYHSIDCVLEISAASEKKILSAKASWHQQ